jgi:hypothetical protein
VKPDKDARFVIVKSGQVNEYDSSNTRETEDYVICIDAIDNKKMKEGAKGIINNVLMTLRLTAWDKIEYVFIRNELKFKREDGKRVFSYTFDGNAPKVYISVHFEQDINHKGQSYYTELSESPHLARVIQLHVVSIKSINDRFRAFLSAWNAFEIFIHKTFDLVEKSLSLNLSNREIGQGEKSYLEKLRSLATEKLNMGDKFTILANHYAPLHAEKDLEVFASLKKQRNELAHGVLIADSDLKVEQAQELLIRYLKACLDNRTASVLIK